MNDERSGFPSMTALLAMLAIAGYQNRDKIAEMIKGVSGGSKLPGAPGNASAQDSGNAAAQGSGGLGDLLGGATAGGLLTGGLGELLKQFTQNGQKDTVDSWIGTGPNKQIAPPDLKTALGPEVVQSIARATGMSEQDLLAKLSDILPQAVDKYTPDGKIAG